MKSNELPTWAKGVIAVAAVGSAVAIGIAIRNAIQKGKETKGDKEANKENDKATQDALNALQNQGITASLTDNDALALSRTIENAFHDMESVATEESVMNQIKAKVNSKKCLLSINCFTFKIIFSNSISIEDLFL